MLNLGLTIVLLRADQTDSCGPGSEQLLHQQHLSFLRARALPASCPWGPHGRKPRAHASPSTRTDTAHAHTRAHARAHTRTQLIPLRALLRHPKKLFYGLPDLKFRISIKTEIM